MKPCGFDLQPESDLSAWFELESIIYNSKRNRSSMSNFSPEPLSGFFKARGGGGLFVFKLLFWKEWAPLKKKKDA